jgi:hypothetical protein
MARDLSEVPMAQPVPQHREVGAHVHARHRLAHDVGALEVTPFHGTVTLSSG